MERSDVGRESHLVASGCRSESVARGNRRTGFLTSMALLSMPLSETALLEGRMLPYLPRRRLDCRLLLSVVAPEVWSISMVKTPAQIIAGDHVKEEAPARAAIGELIGIARRKADRSVERRRCSRSAEETLSMNPVARSSVARAEDAARRRPQDRERCFARVLDGASPSTMREDCHSGPACSITRLYLEDNHLPGPTWSAYARRER